MLPQKHRLVMQRSRALQPLLKKKPGGAARLALTILYLWQRESFPVLVRRAPRPNKHLILEPKVISFANRIVTTTTLRRLLIGKCFKLSKGFMHSDHSLNDSEKIVC